MTSFIELWKNPKTHNGSKKYPEKTKQLFAMVLGIELCLVLARQAFYHLSYAASPFCFGYFWDMVSLYAGPAWTATLLFVLLLSPVDGDDRHTPPHPVIGWDGVWAGLELQSSWSPLLLSSQSQSNLDHKNKARGITVPDFKILQILHTTA
jgi:hypothetical protein